MRRTTHWKLSIGFGLAMALLAVFAALASLSTSRLLEDGRRVAHTLEVLATLEGLLSKAHEAETDQRGYIISGDEAFLRTYQAAVSEAAQRLLRLGLLVADHPEQAGRVARLDPLVAERFALMRRAIEVRRAQGVGAAWDMIAAGRGRAKMEEIRLIADRMIVVERKLLDDRIEKSDRSAQVAYVTYGALLLVVLGLLWAVYRVIRRDMAERARVVEALRQSRERFEVAVRGSRDGLWDWDIAADRCYFSPRWKGMLGYEDHEISDAFDEFDSRIHPEDRARVNSTIEDYLRGRLPEYDLEVRLRHKDGTYRWIRARGVALRDDQGFPYRMAGSHTDITDRKDAERRLSDQNRQLEDAARSEREAHEALKLTQSRLVQSERLAGLGQMVAGVAHEINNPLSFVINNAVILGRDVGDLRDLVALYEESDALLAREAPELHARIAGFRESVDIEFLHENLGKLLRRSDDGLKRIQQVVKDLRLFARLDEGDIQEANLNAGIESSVTIIRGNARREDVELIMDLGAIPPVSCFPAKINQVILNLLSNAVDACGPGGVVTARTRAEDGWVRIEVADTGSGIEPAIRDRIFDPFFTTKPVGRGTGLGLSISYGIVREHGGTIAVESTPGSGSTFIVRLPQVLEVPAREKRDGPPVAASSHPLEPPELMK